MEVNVRENVLYSSTHTLDERTEVAEACLLGLGLEFPAVVDGPDDSVERAYTGWPDRLYVIDAEGRVAYKSDAGPFGFEPSGVRTTLERLLPEAGSEITPAG